MCGHRHASGLASWPDDRVTSHSETALRLRLSWASSWYTDGDDEERLETFRMGGEEACDFIIVEREPTRASPSCVCGEVGASGHESRFQFRKPVAALAEGGGKGVEVGKVEQDGTGVVRQGLFEAEETRGFSEISIGKKLELV